MKKLITSALALFLAAIGVIGTGYAQTETDQLIASTFFPSIENPLNAEKFYADNTKAVRNFKKDFKNTSNESWYALKDGYRVKFLQEGVYNMTDYNANGKWIRTIRYYGEDRLPKTIREAVRRQYFDFNIFLVTEMNVARSTIYLVKIEDKKSWKTLRITPDEMEVIEDFTK